MEILFGNKGIYHYMDAKLGTMRQLEEQGWMYRVQMLVENNMPYILPASLICTDGEVWLSHSTKDCYSLQAVLQQRSVDGTWLKRILRQIALCVEKMESYLLDASDLVLQIEYLFIEKQTDEIRMMCIPGHQKPMKQQLCAFLEYLMPRFEHNDRKGEYFLYTCHQILSDEWKDLSQFFAFLKEEPESGSKIMIQKPEIVQDESDRDVVSEEQQEQNKESIVTDTVFTKRFFLFALAGGAALALIVKYLFFDGTTATAIFGIVWLLALIILAVMLVRDKEDEDGESAMHAYAEMKKEDKETSFYEKHLENPGLCMDREEYVPVASKPCVKLVPLTNGALDPFRIPADAAVLTIGRDKNSDYRVATTQISRVHVRLFRRPDGLYIEDQNSTNGTYINTKRIPAMTEQKLEKGDVVGLANEEFFVA